MDVANVAVGLQYQLAAVPVALPAGSSLHVDAAFDRCRDEHAPQTAVRMIRESQPLAGFGYRLACLFNVEQFFARLLPVAEFLHQRARPRVNGNRETLSRFAAVNEAQGRQRNPSVKKFRHRLEPLVRCVIVAEAAA